jgi:hypothetical protein
MEVFQFPSRLNDGVYYIAVKAIDSVGDSTVKCSSAFRIDTSPPVFTLLSDDPPGRNRDAEFSNVQGLACAWIKVSDPDSGLRAITATFSDSNGTVLIPATAFTVTESMRHCFPASPILTFGHSYYTNVTVSNDCTGLVTVRTTNGYLYETDPPIMGVLYGGPNYQDVRPWSSMAHFPASWTPPGDLIAGVESLTVDFVSCDTTSIVYGSRSELAPNTTTIVFDVTVSMAVGTHVCSVLTAIDRAGNAATIISNVSIYDPVLPTGSTIDFGGSGLRASHRKFWNATVGITAAYSGIVAGLVADIDTLEWASYQCPIGYWVFPHFDGPDQLVGLNTLCTVLQPFAQLPPVVHGALVNSTTRLKDNTTVVLVMRGMSTAYPSVIIPVTVSDAIIVDIYDTGDTHGAWVSTGSGPNEAVPIIDCRSHAFVEVRWGGFTPAPAGTLSYYWAVANATLFPGPLTAWNDSVMETVRDSLAWMPVGLSQNATISASFFSVHRDTRVAVYATGYLGGLSDIVMSAPFRIVNTNASGDIVIDAAVNRTALSLDVSWTLTR